MALPRVKVPPRESLTWWWHPNRPGVRMGPAWFDKMAHEVDENVAVTWSGWHQRWLVWLKAPQFNHPVCWGWKLLFVVREDDGSYRPLDERVLARLYSASMKKWGTAKKYFDAYQREQARDKEVRDKDNWNDTLSQAMESFEHSQIKVGYGPSSGSKFSDYHS